MITAANKYSTPCWATSVPITTAIAPVAPEIMPGRPPIIEVTKPIVKAAYKPTNGSTPANNAKATASGTSARATVKPDKKSFLALIGAYLLINENNIFFLVSKFKLSCGYKIEPGTTGVADLTSAFCAR